MTTQPSSMPLPCFSNEDSLATAKTNEGKFRLRLVAVLSVVCSLIILLLSRTSVSLRPTGLFTPRDLIFKGDDDCAIGADNCNENEVCADTDGSFTCKSWQQIGVDIDGEAAGDYSGGSVSLSSDGTTVAIGASYNAGNGDRSGHVRVFKLNDNSVWNQIGADIDGEAADDNSGRSVSLSADGTTVAIGAYRNDDNGGSSGHVRVFKWDGTSAWKQIGADIDGEAAGDESGVSVSLSSDGTTVAIGAPYNDGNGDRSGHVRVFKFDDNSTWNQIGADIDGEAASDESGWSFSLSVDGTTVAIGAIYNDGNGDRSGHVRVFKWDGTSAWKQIGADIDGETADDESGVSVSLSADGTTVAIGAIYNDGNGNDSGHVRVLEWDGTSVWKQIGADIEGEAASDESGSSVSLSADGTTVAIGAIYNGDNGNDSGHVRVFKLDGTSAWNQIGADIDGEAANDFSGWSVSVSADGTTVAIGEPYNGDNSNFSGRVRVYSLVV